MTTACARDSGADPPIAATVCLAVVAAHARVVSVGQRLTAPRHRVLELLLTAGGPVKAYDLIAAFHSDGRVAKPATVYRALDFLQGMGLVHRLSSLKSYVLCSAQHDANAAAFLICDCCGSCREIGSAAAAMLRPAAEAAGYSIDRITVEIQGTCPACCPASG